MTIRPDQITIAITVFSRRQYLKQAISSALSQTLPVRVIVVEDCGPDPTLRRFVEDEFGSAVEYHRNPVRRGIFGNWNACIELCQTPWLSILHDDDYLAGNFIELLIELGSRVPGKQLYYGHTEAVHEDGSPAPGLSLDRPRVPFRSIELTDAVQTTPMLFPGHIFSVKAAQAAGGFRAASLFTGNWEMWSLLIARFGAAQTNSTVAYHRVHSGLDRGTNSVFRSGKQLALAFVQSKRVIALLKQQGTQIELDRRKALAACPIPTRVPLQHGNTMSTRLFRYNVQLLLISKAPNWRYRCFQWLTRLFGSRFVLLASQAWRIRRRNDG